ncbi:MAG: hypothetical protein HFACDABA_02059 [Anaerolineales bacterium]|nr:hypothetical protein [Anaerolineales bacterium]
MNAKLHKLFACFLSLILTLALTFGPLGASPARAATISFTNLNDSGPGSLRQAIADAAPGDFIMSSPALGDGTIHLASTLTIEKDLSIVSHPSAMPITLSGDTNNNGVGDVRVLVVNSGVTLFLDRINIKFGKATEGGGILNNGTLMIHKVVMDLNSATAFGGGAIKNNGDLDIMYSEFTGNSAVSSGGAIRSVGLGDFGIQQSFFRNNSAREGGAIGNSGSLAVFNSTFFENSATLYGGGAINNSNMLMIKNSTLSQNSAVTGGGGISNYGGGTLYYANTIIANSTGGDCFNNSTIGTNTSNLVEDGSCSAALNGDPDLADYAPGYALNGGNTRTIALNPGSPARDAGDDSTCLLFDQRDVLRPQGAHCDIGAYEAAESLVVTNTNNDGAGSLGNTIRAAAALDTITFDAALSGATIYLDNTLVIDKELTIDGSALASSIILSGDANQDGSGDLRILQVMGGDVILDSLTFTKGASATHGGAIYITGGNLQLLNSVLAGNTAGLSGGAIYSLVGLEVANSTIHGNTASNGGGIFNSGAGTLTITTSTISGNMASNSGGGIHNNGTATITASTISGNTAYSGGGIYNKHTATISASTISGNMASNSGGGIYNNETATITASTISGNTAYSGGGIYNNSTATISASTISGNTADSEGGGIVNYDSLSVTNSTLAGNSASGYGSGAIYTWGTTMLTNVTISGNASASQAAVWNQSGTLHLTNTLIANSTGADCQNDGTLGTNVNNLIEDNTCSPALSGDPRLGPLTDNGGPTQTMALQADSPAIDAGNPMICANSTINNLDQRGQVRPVGVTCDIGAFEAERLPVDGATLHTKRPSFDWADIPGATGYQIQVATNPAFKMPKISASLNGAANSQYASTKDLAASAGHFWRVRAKLPGFNKYGPWSPAFVFFTGNPPGVPALTAPASNALLTNLSPTLDWNDSSVPDGTSLDHYQVQVDDSADFSSLIMNQDSAVSNLVVGPLNPNTTYYWRVRSWNTDGDYSGWSVARSFREAMLPPTLLSPIGNTLVGSLKPTFDWSNVIGATKYNIQISLSNTFSPLTVNATIVASQYTATINLKAGKLYYWRVRAIGPNGPSLWSVVESFLTP